MASNRLGERVASLETDMPHVWEKLDLTTDGLAAFGKELTEIRRQFQETTALLRSYGRAALFMAAAGLLHATGQPAAKMAAAGFHLLLKTFQKFPI